MIVPTMYDVQIQKTSVHLNFFLFGISAFAVATAAIHGIVVILNAINAINAGIVMPDALIISAVSAMPSAAPPATFAPMQAANVPKVATTFSFAISPVIADTINTQPHSLS